MGIANKLAQLNANPALKEWVLAQLNAAQQVQVDNTILQEQLRRKEQDLHTKDCKIKALTLELAYHKRLKFSAKIEAFKAQQRNLFLETEQSDLAAMQAELAQLSSSSATRKPSQTGRKALPAELPHIVHRHEPKSCTCGECGKALVKIGEDISEQLDVEPARFFVHHPWPYRAETRSCKSVPLRRRTAMLCELPATPYSPPQYACRACETVNAAAIPAAVIDGGLAAPGLLAWVVIQKYLDHLPLYRIEQISTRHGVGIARSTLAEWVGRIGVALQPLSERLAQLLKQGQVLHADVPCRARQVGDLSLRQAQNSLRLLCVRT